MLSLRTVGQAVLFAAFVAFAAEGVHGWATARPGAPAEPVPGAAGTSLDEVPLQIGFLPPARVAHSASMGFPWADLMPAFEKARRDLPPDPHPEAGVEAENHIRELLRELRFALPEGQVRWGRLVEVLRARIEPHGIKVLTPEPKIAESFQIFLPSEEWTGATALNHIMTASNGTAVYVVTSDGVGLGSDAACNKVVRDAALSVLRRRVAADNAAPDLDLPVRPDVKDAELTSFLRVMQAQTGVQVAMDPSVWDSGPALTWRGEPRPLRQALDELCSRFKWYWRYHGGRVWLIKP